MIEQHDGHHRLGDGGSADADTRIMATGGDELDGLAVDVDAAARDLDAGGRLQRGMHDDVLPARDAAEHAAGVVRQEPRGRELIAVLAATLAGDAHAGADLDRLHGVDAHHCVSEVGIEPVEHRLAEPRGHALRNHCDARADGVALFAQPPDKLF